MAGHLFHIERNNEPKKTRACLNLFALFQLFEDASSINISDIVKLNLKNASFAAFGGDDMLYKWNVT